MLQGQALEEIYLLGQERSPSEACGILLPQPYKGSWIIELPNRSHHPHDSFEYNTMDIRLALADWLEEAEGDDIRGIALWHTHPSGGIGPSRIDMRNRIPDSHHLVVTLTNEGPVPSWY